MTTLTSRRDAADLATLQLSVRWPVLAQVLFPRAGLLADAHIEILLTLDQRRDHLRGNVVVRASQSGAIAPTVLLERAIAGTSARVNGWESIELACSGGLTVEVVRRVGAPDSPCYVKTDLFAILRIDGGRYGVPALACPPPM